MRLITSALAHQIQRRVVEYAYDSTAIYIMPDPDDTLDEYGQPTGATIEVPVSCSFNIVTQARMIELWRDFADVSQIFGEIHLRDVAPNKAGKFRITGRFSDQNYVDELFEVVYVDDRGTFGYMCLLQQVKI